jgi:DNA mismatch endonuclease (patch repair protein)
MSRAARRDTNPEVSLRRVLHSRGLRFRIHRKVATIPRREIDIVFPRERVAVFVDGCFWHSCPEHGTMPAANRNFWEAKLAANHRRDADTDARLRAADWLVIRVWEHERPEAAADRIETGVINRRLTKVKS